ncbi:MAG: SMC family ATPase, partial [Methanosarcinales archaeon]|nr:SMC family ATPase [Methanosarcinales archaeon]
MLIQSLKLENIKSYKKETIGFKEGINGISGLNGHGKTTILESIGYALFDSLPYSAKDFVRKGEKTGKVTLDITDSDGIGYRIVRKVGASTGYWIERDGLPNIENKVDVQAFIMDTFFPFVGGADLKSVFENAVGVAQGTFSTSFSQTSGVRKSTFDK